LKYIYGTNSLNPSGTTFEQASPRITGVSRMLLILYFYFFCILLAKPKKIFFYIIPIILLLLIYKMQSRGTFVGVAISLLIIIFLTNFNFQLKLKILFLVFLLPILLFESYYYVKLNSISINFNEKVDEVKNDNMASYKNRIFSEKTTSGRTTIWQNIIFIIKEKKIILGYGPQADRDLLLDFKIKYEKKGIFLDKDKNRFTYDNNASNAFFYSYLCGGLFAFVILITIYLITFKKIFKKILYQKIFKSRRVFESFAILLIIYLLQRGIYENSISLFSIDFLFFILSFQYIVQSKVKEIYR